MTGPALVVAVLLAVGAGALGFVAGARARKIAGPAIEAPGQTLTPAEAPSLEAVNGLLHELNRAVRALSVPLNQREALSAVSAQLHEMFEPTVICLLEHDSVSDEWVPKLAEGCVLKPTAALHEVPPPLSNVVKNHAGAVHSRLDVDGISAGSGSGVYVPLLVGDRTVGVLGIEHRVADRYSNDDLELLEAESRELALTVDNARWYGRLRSLGAEEERVRVAQDLHDRLGQWLTFVSFELERMITTDAVNADELTKLYSDVQTALDELREMLRQLRSGVAAGRPLERVGADIVERFVERTGIDATFVARSPDEHLSVPIENELLRILQEALGNVDKHAMATRVEVMWDVRDGGGRLTIRDNGVGFDQARGVRDSAYGLVGMRERADVIGGRLQVSSSPGSGTSIVVTAGTMVDAVGSVAADAKES